MRVLFAGSPEIAVPALEAIALRHQVVGVLSNPDAPKGRGLAVERTPIAARAAELLPGVPILTPARLGQVERDAVAALRPDVLAVFAYGHIFGPKFLGLFHLGGINAHPSLLPRWRGCAPIPYAIMHRDERTGVSVQRIAARMDAGEILAQTAFELTGSETTGSLSERCALLGAGMMADALDLLKEGTECGEPQDERQATYSAAISKDDGKIDFSTDVRDLYARVRAFDPWPGSWTTLNGDRLAVLAMEPHDDEDAALGVAHGTILRVDKFNGIMVKTGRGLAALKRLQLRGKKPLGFKEFSNGARGLEGTILGI
ncbi:MAG: methionyl-tRNA formyltransferase [Spirochaetales bacterium]|nr:MAG: methionyl-tRNA formyltransferase [Spirochaetales bacterium]